MEDVRCSQLLDELIRFLHRPVIKLQLCPSEEIAMLQMQIQDLNDQLQQMSSKYEVLQYRYSDEVSRNLRYEDEFRRRHIKFK